ncbi:DNA primase [Streptomyces sp. NPDC003247]|uniref:DNA primase n=1 Tax=Streptomyces sp. NPDC003247 TaxID=3364677 RepID=UPI00367AFD71
MNRVGLGLAIGAGYALGRTKKMKLALAVGSMVAGKRLNLTPRAVADLLSQQLRDNPQFKEIGDQLRQDLRGVGKAASGAMVERQVNAIADRLHGRTAQVRDQLSGVVPDVPGTRGRRDDEDEYDEDDTYDEDEYEEPEEEEPEEEEPEEEGPEAEEPEDEGGEPPRKKAAAKKVPAPQAPEKRAPEKRAAKKAPAKKAPVKKAPALAAKKTAAAKKAAARTVSRARGAKGGGER